MSNKAATEDDLGNLHNKVAKVMTNALTQIEVAQEQFGTLQEAAGDDPELIAGILDKRPEVSPALLSAMTKFLADNHITCNDEQGAASGLKDTLAGKRKRSANGARIGVGNVVPFAPDD
jgi:hypothetical protein